MNGPFSRSTGKNGAQAAPRSDEQFQAVDFLKIWEYGIAYFISNN
jgi:hypothetical protein